MEVLKLCKKKDINICIDIVGYGFGEYGEILKYIDLVLFDIKYIIREGYKNIILMEIDELLKFLEVMKKNNIKIWIRYVIVLGIIDEEEYLK